MSGLIQRRQQLENYHVRARFGIARLYDSLIIEKEKQAQQTEQQTESSDEAETISTGETSNTEQSPEPTTESSTDSKGADNAKHDEEGSASD